jgi:hydrogenase-1 operon protein HyaF
MSGLDDIAVSVETAGPSSGQVIAILNEIGALLDRLVQHGEQNAIDLRSLPLFPGDYQALKQALGEGEVQATLNAIGPSTLQETAIPGVWWVTHYNENDETVAELIEITSIPELLKTTEPDLQQATQRLQACIDNLNEHDTSQTQL